MTMAIAKEREMIDVRIGIAVSPEGWWYACGGHLPGDEEKGIEPADLDCCSEVLSDSLRGDDGEMPDDNTFCGYIITTKVPLPTGEPEEFDGRIEGLSMAKIKATVDAREHKGAAPKAAKVRADWGGPIQPGILTPASDPT